MLDRICQYSTIIFAGNVAVLIIVSVATDYWEYRGFNLEDIKKEIAAVKKVHKTAIEFPGDTKSYFTIKYTWNDTKHRDVDFSDVEHSGSIKLVKENVYQSPALLKRFFIISRNHSRSLPPNRIVKKSGVTVEDKLVLFYQYGNLFRDCDQLEVGVRTRLGMTQIRKDRCFNFITAQRKNDHFIVRDTPAVIHLERVSFIFALISILASTISVVAGGYGSLTQDKIGMLTASSFALVSGISLTVTIALFHGKCHLLHRRQFLKGYVTPFNKIVDENRHYYFGWSFALAWICVALCFIHTWVWLLKAQDMPPVGYRLKKRRSAHAAGDSFHPNEKRTFLNSERA